ncbi:GH20342 [Drosophila grimshawi]|uniref:GH20342 n=1 Tax=Drosophila grimshawi TaxID=7222 RepID=B4J4G4_DROGR|nr:GH20342 [Drosophila grimshawi]
MQGGIKEEEYFSSVNHGLMSNIQKHIETSKNADSLRKWEEYQRTLDHATLSDTTCTNKNKDIHEEAFFLNEASTFIRFHNIRSYSYCIQQSTECFKAMNNRGKIPGNTEEEDS